MSDFVYRHLPGRSGQATRTLLLLHGTGGDEESLLGLADRLDPEAPVLSPRGKVLENGAPRWFRRFAEGVFDLEDLRLRVGELADFLAEKATELGLSAAPPVAVGYSNGANMAAAMLLLRPESLSGAVLLRPIVPIRPDAPPDLSGKRVLILSGEHDPLCPPSEGVALAALLAGFGAQVDTRLLPASHGLTPEDFELARAWLGTT